MDCKDDKVILTYRFSKDMVASTQENRLTATPQYSSKNLTVSRRIGDCPGQAPGKPL